MAIGRQLSDWSTGVADPNLYPDPPYPHVFGPPGSRSGSISQRYGSGSFYHKFEESFLYDRLE
jgi:hypothetical protein